MRYARIFNCSSANRKFYQEIDFLGRKVYHSFRFRVQDSTTLSATAGPFEGERYMVPTSKLGKTLLAGFWVAGSICAVGCGPKTDKAAIKGTVKFKDGRTITRGVIEFTPLGSASGGGPATTSGSRIVDSAYEVPPGKGLRPGKYRVRINAASGFPTAQGGPGAALTLPKEIVSAKYNEDSKIEIEVRPNMAEETFDFEVEGG
jgi:hypothetical protein